MTYYNRKMKQRFLRSQSFKEEAGSLRRSHHFSTELKSKSDICFNKLAIQCWMVLYGIILHTASWFVTIVDFLASRFSTGTEIPWKQGLSIMITEKFYQQVLSQLGIQWEALWQGQQLFIQSLDRVQCEQYSLCRALTGISHICSTMHQIKERWYISSVYIVLCIVSRLSCSCAIQKDIMKIGTMTSE